MKKTLVALAALASFGAFAQSSVSLYGTLDVGYGSFSSQLQGATGVAGAKVAQKGLMYNNNDSSRWGIATSEDLGGGMKAGVAIESWIGGLPRANFGYGTNSAGMSNNAGTTTAPTQLNKEVFSGSAAGQTIDATRLGDRLMFATLTSGSSEIRLGQQSSFTRDIIVGFQADNSNVTGNLAANDGTLTARYVQAAYLYTGNGYGLGVALSNNVRSQSDVNQVNSAKGFHLKATGQNGPLAGGVAYSDVKTDAASGTAGTASTTAQLNAPTIASLIATPTSSATSKVFAAVVSYDLDVAKVYGEYGSVKVTDPQADLIGGTATTGAGDNHTTKRYTYNAGVRKPYGSAGSFMFAQYSNGKNGFNSGSIVAGGAGTEYVGKWTGYSVGVKHALSKRTQAFVNYGTSSYDISDTITLKAAQFGAGMIHAF